MFVLLSISVRVEFPIAIVHFILPLPQGSKTHLVKTPFAAHHTYMVIWVTELFSHTAYERWFCQLCEPWKALPRDHPKGLVHGTEAAICSDKDSFYLPFFTRTHLYVLASPVGLTQKIKDQALIMKLGKLTSQEINPNCCPRVLGTFGNWESRQLSAHYAVGKRKKHNSPPFKVTRVNVETT